MRISRRNRLTMTMLACGALLLSVALAGNTAGDCTPVEPVQECVVDSDCQGVPLYDCEGAWDCVEGSCVFECGENPDVCYSDSDCAADETCLINDLNECCPPGALCLMYMPPCEGICVANEDPFECRDDADCASGERCVFAWDECPLPPGCEEGEICPAVCGEPVAIASHCEADGPQECRTNADCAEMPQPMVDCIGDWVCMEGQCVFECGNTNVCAAVLCPEGTMCVEVCEAYDCEPGMDCMVEPYCFAECVPIEENVCDDVVCAPGEECIEVCAYPDCAFDDPNADCMTGEPFCWGECVPVQEQCRMASDCEGLPHIECVGDWACVGGLCVFECGGSEQCMSDADCADGFHCEYLPSGYCCPPNALCDDTLPPCMGECVPDEPEGCLVDSDCDEGMVCVMTPCAAPCDSDDPGCVVEPCFGVCVRPEQPAECGSDWDCAPDERCEINVEECLIGCPGPEYGYDCLPCFGQCVPIKECRSDQDCPGDTFCDFGEFGCPAMPECSPDAEDCFVPDCVGVCRELYYL